MSSHATDLVSMRNLLREWLSCIRTQRVNKTAKTICTAVTVRYVIPLGHRIAYQQDASIAALTVLQQNRPCYCSSLSLSLSLSLSVCLFITAHVYYNRIYIRIKLETR